MKTFIYGLWLYDSLCFVSSKDASQLTLKLHNFANFPQKPINLYIIEIITIVAVHLSYLRVIILTWSDVRASNVAVGEMP